MYDQFGRVLFQFFALIHAFSLLLFGLLALKADEARVVEKDLQCLIPSFFDQDLARLHILFSELVYDNRSTTARIEQTCSILERAGHECHFLFGDRSEIRCIVGLLRAPRGTGEEVLFLSADLSQSPQSASLLLFVARLLSDDPSAPSLRRSWLTKDIVFLFSVTQDGIDTFLSLADSDRRAAVTLHGSGLGWRRSPGHAPLSGISVAAVAAISLEGLAGGSAEAHRITIMAEGMHLRQPNLDLVSLLTNSAAWIDVRAGLVPWFTRPSQGLIWDSSSPTYAVFLESPDPNLRSMLAFTWLEGLSLPRSLHASFTRRGPLDAVGFSIGSERPVLLLRESICRVLGEHDPRLAIFPKGQQHAGTPQESIHPTITLKRRHWAPAFTAGTILLGAVRRLSDLDNHLHHSCSAYALASATYRHRVGDALKPAAAEFALASCWVLALWWRRPRGPPGSIGRALIRAVARWFRLVMSTAAVFMCPFFVWHHRQTLGLTGVRYPCLIGVGCSCGLVAIVRVASRSRWTEIVRCITDVAATFYEWPEETAPPTCVCPMDSAFIPPQGHAQSSCPTFPTTQRALEHINAVTAQLAHNFSSHHLSPVTATMLDPFRRWTSALFDPSPMDCSPQRWAVVLVAAVYVAMANLVALLLSAPFAYLTNVLVIIPIPLVLLATLCFPLTSASQHTIAECTPRSRFCRLMCWLRRSLERQIVHKTLVFFVVVASITPPAFVIFWVHGAAGPGGVGLVNVAEATVRGAVEWGTTLWGWMLFVIVPATTMCVETAGMQIHSIGQSYK